MANQFAASLTFVGLKIIYELFVDNERIVGLSLVEYLFNRLILSFVIQFPGRLEVIFSLLSIVFVIVVGNILELRYTIISVVVKVKLNCISG